ncbi:alpha/beta hydrolase [Actinobacteria bacterium IMCC25003]|nr:alpha/beta hydrolase [Actinobacteria bacterium IMCC25003]
MSLAPEIQAFLQRLENLNLPQVWEAPIEVIRRNTQGRVVTSGPVEAIKEISHRFIPGPTADLPIRIYRPTSASSAPAIVYFHGGGWVLNFLDIYDASLARLANQSGATIISVNYQKAPEHPFPIPFDDCFATLQWVTAHAEELQIDPARIGVAGDSAGANLASGVAIKARDNKIPLAFQLLIYPCNDRNFETESYVKNATGYGLSTQAMQWFWDQYLQGSQHDTNPYAVPMRADSFSGVAPAIIITAQYDPLISDGEKYAALLERDGVTVLYKEYDGMIHGFFTNLAVTPTAQEAIDSVAVEIKKLTQ